jgi:hypothetical protein
LGAYLVQIKVCSSIAIRGCQSGEVKPPETPSFLNSNKYPVLKKASQFMVARISESPKLFS